MKSGFVSFIGRPNAGKSTLLNRIIGTKLAIVSDKPQTTRNRILGVKNYPDGQVVFLDTPGIHRPPEGEPRYPPDYLTDQPERFFAAEIVREKLLQLTHHEIPFSSAVVIDRFEEPQGKNGTLNLYCSIVVERESQKPIVIGRGG